MSVSDSRPYLRRRPNAISFSGNNLCATPRATFAARVLLLNRSRSTPLYMKRTYQPLPASDEPIGIVINRGPRDQSADLPSDHPRVWAYVWAPAPDEIDLALGR